MIRGEALRLVYMDQAREIAACDGIDLNIGTNEFIGILGPSGSGKSSLLYLLSGLKEPSSGKVFLDNRPMPPPASTAAAQLRLNEFGFVFQQPFLIPYLSALENVQITNLTRKSDNPEDLLKRLGLSDKMHRRPDQLSGGEKQRVSVARALVSQPRVIFADEPTAALDHATGAQVLELLVTNRVGALIMVTHDKTMLHNADRICMMEEGKLMELTADQRIVLLCEP